MAIAGKEAESGKRDLDADWNVDFKKHELQFSSALLEDAIQSPPKGAPDPLTRRELRSWLESPTVLDYLKLFKSDVVDPAGRRMLLEPGFCVDEKALSDTIDTLVNLCYGVNVDKAPLPDDAFDATALIARSIVQDNDHVGSPFHGLTTMEEMRWCFDVTVRLLITVFCDLVDKEDGYFMDLLGGAKVKRTGELEFRGKSYHLDNSTTLKERQMVRRLGFNKLCKDYP